METTLNKKDRKLVLEGDWDTFFNEGIQSTKDVPDGTIPMLHDKKKKLAYYKRYSGKSKED